jgi:diaminopimelate epimerase
MTLEFVKMNGAGNDFILIDNRSGTIQLTPEQIVLLCDRHRGIGADGVVLMVPCKSGKADWAWDFYNSDGSGAEMCGNASRCFARYVQRLTGIQNAFSFESRAGVIRVTLLGDKVTVDMTNPTGMKLNQKVLLNSGEKTIHSMDTGVPHAVMFVPDADLAMVQAVGADVRFHKFFAPRGTNVNFVQLLGNNSIRVRTYERGVEAETLACGTGVTASALLSAQLHGLVSPVSVKVEGGDILQVAFTRGKDGFTNVKLSGPADFAFDGHITL